MASCNSWIQDLREGNVGHVQRRRLSGKKTKRGITCDTRVIFLTLPETNILAPENRPFAPKGNETVFQPSRTSGAKMSISGRVDSGNASDAKICTPHNAWFTFTILHVFAL